MNILQRICGYCIYQERTQSEVRKKLKSLGVSGDEAEEIISRLITENFINEERFAKQFAGSKFRVKKWGKIKIRFELKSRGLSEYCIKEGLREIDKEDYFITVRDLLAKKIEELEKLKNPMLIQKKASDYLRQKGFEMEIILMALEGESV